MTAIKSAHDIVLWNNMPFHIPDGLDVLADKVEAQPNQVLFRIITKDDGDKRVVWDSQSITQIAEAKRMFDHLIKEGMVPFRVGTNGEATAEELKDFDAFAEEIIFHDNTSKKRTSKKKEVVFAPIKQMVGG